MIPAKRRQSIGLCLSLRVQSRKVFVPKKPRLHKRGSSGVGGHRRQANGRASSSSASIRIHLTARFCVIRSRGAPRVSIAVIEGLESRKQSLERLNHGSRLSFFSSSL